MYTGPQVVELRKTSGMSRKEFALRTGLTEGKIWRIEMKDNFLPGESEAIEAYVTGNPATFDPAQRPTPQPVEPAEPRVRRQLPTTESVAGPQPVMVGSIPWQRLLRSAAEVSEHDLERYIFEQDQDEPAEGDPARLISNSEVQTWKQCRRKWWLGYYRRLTLRAESPTGALAIGNRVHRALAMYYVPTGKTRVDPRDALERIITSDWEKITLQLADDVEQLLTVKKMFDSESELERAMIEGYVEWIQDTGIDAELTVVASETYLEADITRWLFQADEPDGYLYPRAVKIIGKLDVRAQRQTDGRFVFIDHKTVADLTRPKQTLPLNEQMMHYLLLEFLNSEEGDVLCNAALYNMLRKVKRTDRAKPPFYDRILVQHNRTELDNFKERLLGTIEDMLQVEELLNQGVAVNSLVPPTPTGECTWKCEFFPVCPMFNDGSRVEDMLKIYYKEGDPIQRYRREEAAA